MPLSLSLRCVLPNIFKNLYTVSCTSKINEVTSFENYIVSKFQVNMLPNGSFQPTLFKPDIPKDTLNRLHDRAEKSHEEDGGVSSMTAQERLVQEQQEKESYRASRQKQEKEIVE